MPKLKISRRCRYASLLGSLFWSLSTAISASQPYAIEVLDSRTGRGVPLVEVGTAGGTSQFTDSNGIAAFVDESSFNRDTVFRFSSYGYAGFEQTLRPEANGTGVVRMERINHAERLYRVTGPGIYADSVKVGRAAPISHPLSNANVKGQDSVQSAILNGQIFWLWGDTLYESGSGNYHAAAATSLLPAQGGLDPALGINLTYFTKDGSAREMMPSTAPGPIWIGGLFKIQPPSGKQRLLGHYVRMKTFSPNPSIYQHGLAIYSETDQRFRKLLDYQANTPITATSQAIDYRSNGTDYIYFAYGFPTVRVRRDWYAVVDIAQWEAFTPLLANSRYQAEDPPLEYDSRGEVVYGWKRNTDPLTPCMLAELTKNGHLDPADSPYNFRDHKTGKPMVLASANYQWNNFRKKWIMIGVELDGDSPLGEVWYAEADSLEGPWMYAVKVASHHAKWGDYAFYGPRALPFFDQRGGRWVYFMGTYSATPFGTAPATPLYDYNQVMYRLDLATLPRLPAP